MKTILICDDAKFIVEVTKKVLTKKGYNVVTLESCDSLLEETKKHNPDLILMDLMIPPHGGETAIKFLRSDNDTKHIPVLIFSAHLDLEAIATRIGANGYINKPFEMKQLEAIVDGFFVPKQ
ncbi:MAG: response regulator [Bacteroidia bacterium]